MKNFQSHLYGRLNFYSLEKEVHVANGELRTMSQFFSDSDIFRLGGKKSLNFHRLLSMENVNIKAIGKQKLIPVLMKGEGKDDPNCYI